MRAEFRSIGSGDEPRAGGRLGVSSPSGDSRKASLCWQSFAGKDIPGLLTMVPCGQRDEAKSSEELGHEA